MKTLAHLIALFVPGSARRKVVRHCIRYFFRYSRHLLPHLLPSARAFLRANATHQVQLQEVLTRLEFNPPSEHFLANPCWQTAVAKAPTRILEIGSWQGGSAAVFNHFYPQAQITCVDSWAAPDDLDMTLQPEKYFDANTAHFVDRLHKVKQDSAVALSQMVQAGARFDFIYIDGSHFEDDVLVDSLLAWRLLEVGGTMVWDDYVWEFAPYGGRVVRPAVDHFVRRHWSEMKVVSVYPQVMVRKVGEAERGKLE